MATSPTSSSSFDFLSAPASSEDEVVYPHGESTDSSESESGNESLISDDDDFVVLSRARSPCATGILSSGLSSFGTDDVLSSAMSSLSVSQSSAAVFIRDAVSLRLGGGSTNVPGPIKTAVKVTPKVTKAPKVKPTLTAEQIKRKEKLERKEARKALKKAREAAEGKFSVINDASSVGSQRSEAVPGLTKAQRKKANKALRAAILAAPSSSSAPPFPIVDDTSSLASDAISVTSDDESTTSTATVTGYEDASRFITGFLSSPEDKDSVNKLTLLQSLIMELGVADISSLPTTITSAKKLLKSEAHVNIREYIAVREKGQDALKGIMHASRGSLVKSIRKKKNPASLTWVKQQGLNVLLVQCFC